MAEQLIGKCLNPTSLVVACVDVCGRCMALVLNFSKLQALGVSCLDSCVHKVGRMAISCIAVSDG